MRCFVAVFSFFFTVTYWFFKPLFMTSQRESEPDCSIRLGQVQRYHISSSAFVEAFYCSVLYVFPLIISRCKIDVTLGEKIRNTRFATFQPFRFREICFFFLLHFHLSIVSPHMRNAARDRKMATGSEAGQGSYT